MGCVAELSGKSEPARAERQVETRTETNWRLKAVEGARDDDRGLR